MVVDDVNRSPRPLAVRLVASAAIAAVCALLIVWMARLIGFRSPLFAFNFHFVLMAAAAFIDNTLAPRLTGRRFDVAPWEPRVYRRLGVFVFMRILQRIGWTAAVRQRKDFDGTRNTLAAYERATRHGENAHAWLFVIALGVVTWAMTQGYWDAALWIGSMNVVFHGYPILLQRTQRARLTALLARSSAVGDS